MAMLYPNQRHRKAHYNDIELQLSFFIVFVKKNVCIIIAMCDLVYNVETMFHLNC